MSHERKKRVLQFPVAEGGVGGALASIGAKLGNSEVDGVLLVTTRRTREGHSSLQYELHGTMRRTDLALVGAVMLRWASDGAD